LDEFVPDDQKSAQEIMADLVEHLFVIHPIPPCLKNAWFCGGYGEWEMPPLQWIAWYVLAGQGASIHRARSLFRWNTSAPLLRHFAHAPARLHPEDACAWAEIRRLGGGDEEFQRLRVHAGYAFGPTTPMPDHFRRAEAHEGSAEQFSVFWADTVRWLTKNRTTLTDEMCNLILPWALHQYTEDVADDRVFLWKGRSVAQTHRLAVEYDRSLKLPYEAVCWRSQGWDAAWGVWADQEWTMRELTSGRELYEEGSAMSHCVASYALRCRGGASAIFSLRCNGERRLTLELDPQTRRIVQARGPHNRHPTEEEQQQIEAWQRMKLAELTNQ
jgi:hypothetical protein